MAKYKITQNKEACMGCERCAMVCPANWKEDEKKEGETEIKFGFIKEEIDETELVDNQMAEHGCPTACIKIEEIKE